MTEGAETEGEINSTHLFIITITQMEMTLYEHMLIITFIGVVVVGKNCLN